MTKELTTEERAEFAQEIVARTNYLGTVDFLAFFFTVLGVRYDFQIDFKPIVLEVTDLLINKGIGLFDKGENVAGSLYNDKYTN